MNLPFDNRIVNMLPLAPQALFTPPACLVPQAASFGLYNLIVALDTEWVERLRRNLIRSYQYTALWQHTPGVWTGAEAVIETAGPAMEDRLPLDEILAHVLRSFGIGIRLAAGMRVMLIWHYGLAEWAALRDREALAEHLQFVRNAPVTFKPMEVSVSDESKHSAKLYVEAADTFLLSPGAESSLKSISKITMHKKQELDKGVIEHMDVYRAEDPEGFAAYGINDCRVALEYCLKGVHVLESVLGLKKAPTTLGGAAVSAYETYLAEHPTLDKDTVLGLVDKQIINEKGWKQTSKDECKPRKFSNDMAAHAFYGGLNVAYYKGEYSDPDKVILDLDFSGAYPAALATLPVIDWREHPNEVRSTAPLSELHDGHTQVAFFDVEFEFPSNCMYPCLPVPTRYGLVYPLKGECVATGPEVALALKLSARVVVKKANYFDHLNELAFADYLKMLAQKRAEYTKGTLENMLLKKTSNSFYGKLAQGIRGRNIYNYMEGMQRLKPSAITCPHYAAMCTGIVRAALSVMVHELAQTPGAQVLSATTDGCMVALPKRRVLRADAGGKAVIDFWFHEVYPEVYERFKSHAPIQALAMGRRNMGLEEDTWLEIKHAGDKATTWKTRGNDIVFQCVSQHVARAGHKVDSAAELHEIAASPDVIQLPVPGLASFKDIITGKEADLVAVETLRRANLDWDWKRIPEGETGPTRPVEYTMYTDAARKAGDRVRRRGERATVEAVAAQLDRKDLEVSPAVIKRTVCKAIAHDFSGCRPRGMTDKEIAAALEISYDTFRQYKRRDFYPQCVAPTEAHMTVVKGLIQRLPTCVPSNIFRAVLSR